MICTPKGFKPLLLQIVSTFRREDTVRRLIFFCAAPSKARNATAPIVPACAK